MKCEKCGVDIVEGTLCENCKNVPVVEENAVQVVAPEIPQAYDPVADLMNEPVNGTVNLEKSELENSIPLGDSTGIPEMPTNENVVSVVPQVEAAVEPVVVDATPVVESVAPVVENNVQNVNEVQNTEVVPLVEKKKMSVGAIIAIVVGVLVLLGGGFSIYLRFSNVYEVMDSAKISTFVTEVQEIMDRASTGFMTEAMKPGNQGRSVEFNSNNYPLLEFETNKSYKVNLDRNGRITGIIVYDENFCYGVPDELGQELEKSMVTVNDIMLRDKTDNLNDGCHGVKSN